MNSRERLLTALNHREPDRLPIDLGGTPTSTISATALENLKTHLGIRSETRLASPIFLTAYPDDQLIRRFGVDVKMVTANPPAGFQLKTTAEGRVVDEWGAVYQKLEEAQTHFVVETEAPLHRVTSKEEIKRHPWPDPSDPSRVRGLKEIARKYQRIEDLAPEGGFVLAAVHNLRPEVKPENICALYDAALEYGKYKG